MKQSRPSDFQHFNALPAELRRKIWEATHPRPSIHVFDVCVPSSLGNRRVRQAFEAQGGTFRNEKQYNKYRDTVFLDVAETLPAAGRKFDLDATHEPGPEYFSSDPSMYKAIESVKSTCSEANESLQLHTKSPYAVDNDKTSTSINSVYLPGRDRWIKYDNASDVLALRFGASGSIQNIAQQRLLGDGEDASTFSSGISDVLEVVWSAEIASTIWNARKIALDVADTWAANDLAPIMSEEVAYLSCCLQKDLAVLYLIEQGLEMHTKPGKQHDFLQDLRKVGELRTQLDRSVESREPDVIHGVGVTYHESFNLERLGWSENHSTFVLAQMFDEMIRSQQGNGGPFEGVRVLVSLPKE